MTPEGLPPIPGGRVGVVKALLLPIAVAVALFAGAEWTLPAAPWSEALADFGLGLALCLVPAAFAHRAGINWSEFLGPPAAVRDLRWIGVTLGLMGGSLALLWLLFAPLSVVAPDFVESWVLDAPDLYVVGAPVANALWFVAVVVLAPVGEEIIFRGLLLRRWTVRWGRRTAVAGTSALFALFHVDLLGALLFALVLCSLERVTRGLWAPMAVHALNNFLAWSLEALTITFHWPGVENAAALRADWPLAMAAGAVGLWLLVGLRAYWTGPAQPAVH